MRTGGGDLHSSRLTANGRIPCEFCIVGVLNSRRPGLGDVTRVSCTFPAAIREDRAG
jgi:hypothetical protein